MVVFWSNHRTDQGHRVTVRLDLGREWIMGPFSAKSRWIQDWEDRIENIKIFLVSVATGK